MMSSATGLYQTFYAGRLDERQIGTNKRTGLVRDYLHRDKERSLLSSPVLNTLQLA